MKVSAGVIHLKVLKKASFSVMYVRRPMISQWIIGAWGSSKRNVEEGKISAQTQSFGTAIHVPAAVEIFKE